MPTGIYISVPFCRTKCSYCNFASDVFSKVVFEKYVSRVCQDIQAAARLAREVGAELDRTVDSIYFGGGSPTMIEPSQLERIFVVLRDQFDVDEKSEITVECAPGTITGPLVASLQRCGVNRVSLGVQSFVDEEAAAVGRLHKRKTVLADIAQLRAVGIININIDLIAGLPHQTAASWEFSILQALDTGVPHLSVYMLGVDEGSRLGRELLAGGARYHAQFVPGEEVIAGFYLEACDRLQSAEVSQYEISNFAREGFESRHNLKYWIRQPYLGFGVDAHSMLPAASPRNCAVRFSASDSLENYMSGSSTVDRSEVSFDAALEESFFLGLRLNRGIDLQDLAAKFGGKPLQRARAEIAELVADGLMEKRGDSVFLTARGRLLSNEVFERFLTTNSVPA